MIYHFMNLISLKYGPEVKRLTLSKTLFKQCTYLLNYYCYFHICCKSYLCKYFGYECLIFTKTGLSPSVLSHVITGSGLPVWVKVVSVLGGTSCKWDASPLSLTRWQHTMRQWYQACVVICDPPPPNEA